MRRLISVLGIVIGVTVLAGCGENGTEKVSITAEDVVEETIIIEGLSEEYDLLFLTDTHMVMESPTDSEQMIANRKERASQFIDDRGVSSEKQFSAWMEYANAQLLDAVLLGGDIMDEPSEGNVAHLQRNLDQLAMPYLYTLGNHDWTYPWEYMTEKAEQEYLPLLAPMMKGNTVIQRLDIGELTVVAVDNSSGQVNSQALDTYAAILAEGRPTIVLVHVPFMTQSVLGKAKEIWSSPVVIGAGNYGGIYENEETAAFVEMTTAKESPVVTVLSGHVHFYDRDFIHGEKPVLQFVGDAGYKRRAMRIHFSNKAD